MESSTDSDSEISPRWSDTSTMVFVKCECQHYSLMFMFLTQISVSKVELFDLSEKVCTSLGTGFINSDLKADL